MINKHSFSFHCFFKKYFVFLLFFLVFVLKTSIIKNMKTRNIMLGPLGMRFFAWTQLEQKDQVQTGDFARVSGLSSKQEADLFYKLSSKGFILKLWRGIYLVPKRIPIDGQYTPSPYLIISKYMRNKDAKFQISGPAIFNSYGYSNQISSWFTVYNNKFSKRCYIKQYRIDFVKIVTKRLGDVKQVVSYDEDQSEPAFISSAEQTLLDAVYDYKKFGTLPKAYDWIFYSLKYKKIDPKKLVNTTIKYGNTMTQKRIGWLLDELKLSKRMTNQIQRKIPQTKFLVPLDPKNNKGPINQKWNVIENVKLPS